MTKFTMLRDSRNGVEVFSRSSPERGPSTIADVIA